MIATAKRLKDEGFNVLPHIHARMVKNKASLNNLQLDVLSVYQVESLFYYPVG